MMDSVERKVAFQSQARRDGRTLSAAAYEACGVTWFHLSDGLADKRPLSAEVKQKFAAYVGRSVDEVFGSTDSVHAA